MAVVLDDTKGPRAEPRALTTVGLFHTVCRQCFTAPQSAAVFTFRHHTAEPRVHSLRPRAGLARARGNTRVRGSLVPHSRSAGGTASQPGHLDSGVAPLPAA